MECEGGTALGDVRRRAVLRAGAWAVPAVTVVAAAPPPIGWVEHLNVGPGRFAFTSVAPTSGQVDFSLLLAGTTAWSWLSASLLDASNYAVATSGIQGAWT